MTPIFADLTSKFDKLIGAGLTPKFDRIYGNCPRRAHPDTAIIVLLPRTSVVSSTPHSYSAMRRLALLLSLLLHTSTPLAPGGSLPVLVLGSSRLRLPRLPRRRAPAVAQPQRVRGPRPRARGPAVAARARGLRGRARPLLRRRLPRVRGRRRKVPRRAVESGGHRAPQCADVRERLPVGARGGRARARASTRA